MTRNPMFDNLPSVDEVELMNEFRIPNENYERYLELKAKPITLIGGLGRGRPAQAEHLPTRFRGTVMISSERPARDMHQVVEAIIEQLTTILGASVELKLEIDADVPSGVDKAKSRTLLENANTLGFIDKVLD